MRILLLRTAPRNDLQKAYQWLVQEYGEGVQIDCLGVESKDPMLEQFSQSYTCSGVQLSFARLWPYRKTIKLYDHVYLLHNNDLGRGYWQIELFCMMFAAGKTQVFRATLGSGIRPTAALDLKFFMQKNLFLYRARKVSARQRQHLEGLLPGRQVAKPLRRICLVCNEAGVHIYRVASQLKERGYQVLLISRFVQERFEDIPLALINSGDYKDFLFHNIFNHWVLQFKQLYKDFKPDVINAHFAGDLAYAASLASGNIPVVTTLWGSDVLIAPDRQKNPAGAAFAASSEWALRGVIKRSTMINAASPILLDRAEHYGLPPKKRYEPLYCGIDLDDFPYSAKSKNSQKISIMHIRNYEPVYDVPTVLKAMDFLNRLFPGQFSLDLCAGGSGQADIEQLISELNLAECVTMHSAKAYADQSLLNELMRRSDIYVSASLSDGFSMSLAQAMAVGLLPVVSAIPANRQWIKHGVNGLLFDCGNFEQLAQMLLNASKHWPFYEACLPGNRQLVEKHASLDVSIPNMEKLFNSLTTEVMR